MIFGARHREHVTTPLCETTSLVEREGADYNYDIFLIYNPRNCMVRNYIPDLCVPVTNISTHAAARSAPRVDPQETRTRKRLGNLCPCVAVPVAWNNLPPEICTASTLCICTNGFNAHLFPHFTSIIIYCRATSRWK